MKINSSSKGLVARGGQLRDIINVRRGKSRSKSQVLSQNARLEPRSEIKVEKAKG